MPRFLASNNVLPSTALPPGRIQEGSKPESVSLELETMCSVEANPCMVVNGTVGCGLAGFTGLGWNGRISRWIQASEAPDLQLPEVVRFFLPLMLIAIGVEAAWSHAKGLRLYYLRQSWTNAACGATAFFILGIALRGLTIFPYMALHNLFGLNRGRGVLTHFVTFLAADLAYYLGHWAAHVSNIGWATHNMHHSSPDYNFLTSFRVGTDQFVMWWMFNIPIALIAPIDLFFLHHGAVITYTFFVHTALVDKLHPLYEFIFNTPSHHRVHHARNYPRANYGGALIIWDRLFGTFVEERKDKPCVYGLDERKIPLGTHNPTWQQGHHYWLTLKGAIQARGLDKLRVLFTRKHAEGMVVPNSTDSNEDTVPLSKDGIPCDDRFSSIDIYVSIQGALLFPVSFFTFYYAASLPPLTTILLCGNLLLSFSTMLTLLDEADGMAACRNEIMRWIVVAGTGFWLVSYGLASALTLFCIVSSLCIYYLTMRSKTHKD